MLYKTRDHSAFTHAKNRSIAANSPVAGGRRPSVPALQMLRHEAVRNKKYAPKLPGVIQGVFDYGGNNEIASYMGELEHVPDIKLLRDHKNLTIRFVIENKPGKNYNAYTLPKGDKLLEVGINKGKAKSKGEILANLTHELILHALPVIYEESLDNVLDSATIREQHKEIVHQNPKGEPIVRIKDGSYLEAQKLTLEKLVYDSNYQTALEYAGSLFDEQANVAFILLGNFLNRRDHRAPFDTQYNADFSEDILNKMKGNIERIYTHVFELTIQKNAGSGVIDMGLILLANKVNKAKEAAQKKIDEIITAIPK